MKLEDLRGLTTAQKLSTAAKFAGVPDDLFDKIWKRESQRGDPKWMRSPAGAKGHFGLMDGTRMAWEERLGIKVNPDDFDSSLIVAAHTMRENMRLAEGNLPDALRIYNAGTNRKRWYNDETNKYVEALTGVSSSKAQAAEAASVTVRSDLLDSTPEQLIYGKAGFTADPVQKERQIKPSDKQLEMAALGGVPELRTDNSMRSDAALRKEQQKVVPKENRNWLPDYSNPLKPDNSYFNAFFGDNLVAGLFRSFDRFTDGDADPEHKTWLSRNILQVYKDARDEREFDMLVQTRNANEYALTKQQFKVRQKDEEIKSELPGAGQLLAGLVVGSIDPLNVLLSAGTGGAAKGGLLGSSAIVSSGKPMLGVAAYLGEQASANVAGNALLDAVGEKQTLGDYLMAAGTGLAMGTLTAGGVVHDHLPKGPIAAKTQAALDQAMTELGERADPQAVVNRATEIELDPGFKVLDDAMHGKVSRHAFMPRDDDDLGLLPSKAQELVKEKYNLNSKVSDGADRNVQAELIARSELIDPEIKVDPDFDKIAAATLTRWLPGAESIGQTLLRSESVVARAASKVLLESTTGVAGRRANAAMIAYVHEQRLRQTMRGWDEIQTNFIGSEGYGVITDQITQRGQREFNRRVYLEVERRRQGIVGGEDHQLILAAVDKWERAMDELRVTQQKAGTAGHNRLGDTSVGYAPRRLLVSVVKKLEREDTAGYNAVLDVLAKQLVDPTLDNKFDDKFARRLAKEYLERAIHRWAGEGEIPVMLHEPDASQTLRDALKGMGDVTPEELDKFMGRYSRGGGEWTKKRLDLNLLEELPPGPDGRPRLLADLFDQDMYSLFASQARRVSGEAALARYNIIGEKGLKVMRDAIANTGGSEKDLEAFDHLVAEFIGRPIAGSAVNKQRIPWMDNATVLTSAIRLGGSVFNQMGEYATAMTTLGVHRVFASIGDLPRLNKEIMDSVKGKAVENPILKDFDRIALVGGEDYNSTRLFDPTDRDFQMYGQDNTSNFGRVARSAQRIQHIVSFNRKVTALQTRGLSEQLLKKAFVFIRDGKQDAALKDVGFNSGLISRLKGNLDKIAKFDEKGNLVELNLYKGGISGDDLLELQTILPRAAGQMVQRTFIGEQGTWVSNSLLRMLYQFRSVGLTAIEKQWGRDLASRGGVMAFAGIIAGMSFGIPLQMTRAWLKSQGMTESEREKYLTNQLAPEALALSSLNYATKSGLLSDVVQGVGGVAAGWSNTLGWDNGSKELYQAMTSGSRAGSQDFIGGNVAPAVGVMNDAFKGVQGNPEKLLRLLPGANLIYVQPLINAITADRSEE